MSRTFVTGTTTVRLPLRRAYQCRFSIYVSASGDFAVGQDLPGVSLAATLIVR